jgi:indolepyruvate ferredoxin oxidoreductase
LLVHQPDVLSSLVQPSLPGATAVSPLPETPKATYARLRAELVSYHNEALARHFEQLTMPLQAPMERSAQSRLWQRLCNSLFRVLAYKDEFEVARLHMDREWERAVLSGFEPGAKLVRHVAPEWMGASRNPSGGPTVRPAKISLGPWSRPLWWLLARLRGLRGTPLNPFAHSQDAKNQRILRQLFETLCLLMQNDSSMLRHSKQIEAILSLFDEVKGYGQVRQSAFARVINPLRTAVAELEHLEHHEQGRHQNTEEKRGQAF